MARFDIYPDPDGGGYLLDVQADLLDALNTRVVVPLMPADAAPTPAKRLNPVLTVQLGQYVMVTQFLSAVPVAVLPPPVGSLEAHDAAILDALDMLLTGV
jgi:toxin CcdB